MPIYVISDLHIGAGELDDCDAGCEAALVAFVDQLAASKGSVELVLNGDSFDFVQAQPWRIGGLEASAVDGVPLCFTQSISLRKAQAIIDAHPSIFDAFGRFIARPESMLTILPGNHDADLYWGPVRALLGTRIFGGLADRVAEARLVWHLGRVYRPARAAHVWIEHGHQYDPANSFFVSTTAPPTEYWGDECAPILFDRSGQERLLECLGTRFLIRFLNELDARYPFVDNIKPLSRFLRIFQTSARRLSGGTARAAMSALAFMRFVGVETFAAPGNLLSFATGHAGIGARLMAIDLASDGAFADALRSAGHDFEGRSFDGLVEDDEAAIRLLDFALAHLDVLDTVTIDADSMLGIEGDDGMLTLAKGFSLDETQLLRDGATDALKSPGCRCVIMGHTHEPVDDAGYKNTGSWTRYWQMMADDNPTWSEMVVRAPALPMSPRYARVPEEPSRDVELFAFDPSALRSSVA